MVECRNPEALAGSAIRLLEDTALAARIISSARAECDKYCWSAMRERWIGLYSSLAGRESALT